MIGHVGRMYTDGYNLRCTQVLFFFPIISERKSYTDSDPLILDILLDYLRFPDMTNGKGLITRCLDKPLIFSLLKSSSERG